MGGGGGGHQLEGVTKTELHASDTIRSTHGERPSSNNEENRLTHCHSSIS